MGVPGLFANLHNKYKKYIIKKKINNDDNKILNTDNLLNISLSIINLKPYFLFFDFNCLIHPICHLIWDEYKDKNISLDEFEHKIIMKSTEYMEKVIKYAEPTFCGIYIDGTCPMSKIAQQRQRRFASVIDKEVMNNIRTKFGVKKENYYDTNSITPGTEFMEKFNIYLTEYINEKNKYDGVKFIYSSYREAGEGEHKIINYIKSNKEQFDKKDVLIYGLDADLIILSLTMLKTNDIKIMLLREEDKVSFDNFSMIYFDINMCANCLIHDLTTLDETEQFPFNDTSKQKIMFDKYNNIIDDFVFITILLGNDFIPANPSLNMKFRNKNTQGYDLLIDTYKKLFNENISENKYIVKWTDNKLIINWTFYTELIRELTLFEQLYFIHAKNFNNQLHTKVFKNKADEQIFKMENLIFSHPDPLKMNNPNINYEIRKKRFIHHYFGGKVCVCTDSNNKKYQSQLLSNAYQIDSNFYDNKNLEIRQDLYDNKIRTYLKTMSYVMYYYYQGCPDNLYYYNNFNSILLSDLIDYLTNKIKINKYLDNIINTFHKKRYTHINPLEQLLLVLPNKSFNLLPKNIEKFLRTDKSDNDLLNAFNMFYFPKNIKRDLLNKTKMFQSTLILSLPSIELIKGLISEQKILEKDINRCFNI
jgi:5'-3' exonuclease